MILFFNMQPGLSSFSLEKFRVTGWQGAELYRSCYFVICIQRKQINHEYKYNQNSYRIPTIPS